MFCAPFFHFYAHDKTGPIGESLRNILAPIQEMTPGVDDERTFAIAFVSLFMQIVGILQLPQFLGSSFSPFVSIRNAIDAPLNAVLTGGGKSPDLKYNTKSVESDDDIDMADEPVKPAGKKKPKKKKGKQKSS